VQRTKVCRFLLLRWLQGHLLRGCESKRRAGCWAVRLLVGDAEHDLAAFVVAHAALGRRAAIGESEDLADRRPQITAIDGPRELDQCSRLDDEARRR
jgi:hypothetical protein